MRLSNISSTVGCCRNALSFTVQQKRARVAAFDIRSIRFYSNSLYGSTETLKKDLFSDSIPHVELNYSVMQFDKENDTDASKSPLIVLHGLFGSKASNHSMSKRLVEGLKRNVYSLELRNHGDSPHNARHDYPAMANDVEKWVTGKSFAHKPIIIGHSMGAKVAMSCVLRKPDMFAGLCSIDNAPVAFIPSPIFPKYLKQLMKIVNDPQVSTTKQCMEILGEVEKRLVVNHFLMTTLTKYKDVNTHKTRYKSKIPLDHLLDAMVKGNVATWEFTPCVHRWSGPSLFIKGTKSDYCSDEAVINISQFFPSFEQRNIEGSHWVNAENPKGCATAIIDFVEKFEDK